MAGKWPKGTNVVAIVPAYNEARRIANAVRQLRQRKEEGLIQEIIVVDDGSKDKTAETAKKAGADKVISLRSNKGKAMAFATGVRDTAKRYNHQKTIVLTLDADLKEIKASQIEMMIEPFMGRRKANKELNMISGKVGVISRQYLGQRAIRLKALGGLIRNTKLWKRLVKTGYGLEQALDYIIKNKDVVYTNFEISRSPRLGKRGHAEIWATETYLKSRKDNAELLRFRRTKLEEFSQARKKKLRREALDFTRKVDKKYWKGTIRQINAVRKQTRRK